MEGEEVTADVAILSSFLGVPAGSHAAKGNMLAKKRYCAGAGNWVAVVMHAKAQSFVFSMNDATAREVERGGKRETTEKRQSVSE